MNTPELDDLLAPVRKRAAEVAGELAALEEKANKVREEHRRLNRVLKAAQETPAQQRRNGSAKEARRRSTQLIGERGLNRLRESLRQLGEEEFGTRIVAERSGLSVGATAQGLNRLRESGEVRLVGTSKGRGKGRVYKAVV